MEPTSKILTVPYDYHQLYVRDGAHEFSAERNDLLDALDAATESGLSIGVASGVVDILMPRQENFFAQLELSITRSSPPVIETADHIVEFGLISSGRVGLEGSGGSGEAEIEITPGSYRVRLSGFDFDAAASWSYDDPGHPSDHYRLELWPVGEPGSPTELKRWAGYADRI